MKNTILFLLIILVSCRNKIEIKDNWQKIRISVDTNRFVMLNVKSTEADSIYYVKYDKSKLHLVDSTTNMYEDKNKYIGYFLSKQERKDLLDYCYQTIINPDTLTGRVSDYQGQFVLIQIEKGQTVISCKYSSVANWQSISPTLKKIDELTFGKIKPPSKPNN